MAYWFGEEIIDLYDAEIFIWCGFCAIALYWIFFSFNISTISQTSDNDKDHIKASSPSPFAKIKFGLVSTKLARGIVMFIVFIVVTFLWTASKEIMPESFVGGVIRSGIALLILYSMWRKVLPMINIGSQKEDSE